MIEAALWSTGGLGKLAKGSVTAFKSASRLVGDIASGRVRVISPVYIAGDGNAIRLNSGIDPTKIRFKNPLVANSSRVGKTAADNTVFTKSKEFVATQSGGTGITYKVFQRNDVDWNMVREIGAKKGRGLTNAEAASKHGLAPVLGVNENGKAIVSTLHHSQQNAAGPLFEASTKYHNISNAQKAPLHPFGKTQNPYNPLGSGPGSLRDQFQRVDSLEYWKWRGTQQLDNLK